MGRAARSGDNPVSNKEGALKFGLMYLFSEFGDTPQAQVFHEFLDEVEAAEALGFNSVWIAEHHFSVYGMDPNESHDRFAEGLGIRFGKAPPALRERPKPVDGSRGRCLGGSRIAARLKSLTDADIRCFLLS